jgi:acetyl esterase/lipase
MRKIMGLAAAMLLAIDGASARAAEPTTVSAEAPWRPGEGLSQIPLWPADLAIARPALTGPETARIGKGGVAGRPVTMIENVERPTMTVYPAKGSNTGAAVLVFPGGGYRALAIDLEGSEVCDWLTAKGITCVVLKYRVPGSGHYWNAACKCHKIPEIPMALQDAQRAMTILRRRAAEWGVNPRKIGVLGFSAGGHLVTAVTNADALSYAPVDASDVESSRPDFGVALYPGHLWSGTAMDLHPFNRISAHIPPTFIIQAEDDPVDDVRNSIAYFLALRAAGAPVEMHIYAHGGHAFALRPTAQPITRWPALVETWLRTIGVL